ncbi:ABC transporter substrate-binding protein [Geodermatophilus sp. CPCC 206100]|uniref:ABC transporter substrate-binding protein n=1 Tax=Geodermatophilus sp. CPCC 206100 TaxID=3020054 RepID=UPI003B00CD14
MSNRLPRSQATMAMATAVFVLSLAACGGSSGGSGAVAAGNEGGEETTAIVVGVQPFAVVVPFYVAMERGMFEDAGLEVTTQGATSGAPLVSAMVAGEVDIANANYVSLIQAASEGLPLRAIRENDRADVQGLYAGPASGISSPADLAGKRVAINGLGNIAELTTRAALEENGVDPDSVQFVELPLPDMPAALASGNVDAAWLAEPFVTMTADSMQAALVLDTSTGPTEDFPISGWMSSAQFAEENPEALAAFVEVMDEAIALVADDPSLVAETVPSFTTISPEVAAKLAPINWAVDSDLQRLRTVEELMREYGVLQEEYDVDEIIINPGG